VAIAANGERRRERRCVVGQQPEVAAGNVEAVRSGGDTADAIDVAAARLEFARGTARPAPRLLPDRRRHLAIGAGGEDGGGCKRGDRTAPKESLAAFTALPPPPSMFHEDVGLLSVGDVKPASRGVYGDGTGE